jgi:hypothetical protein
LPALYKGRGVSAKQQKLVSQHDPFIAVAASVLWMIFLSASLNVESDWNFRVLEKRLVVVKTIAQNIGKVAVLDVASNVMFSVEVKENVSVTPISRLTAGKEYYFNIRVLTSKNLDDIKEDAISFFEAVDIDQSMDDFIKAYWLYPSKIRFQLTEAEEPA